MSALPYILPWILILLGIGLALAVKLIPIKSIMGIITVSVMGLLMLLAGIFQNIISSQLDGQLTQQTENLANLEEWKYKHLDELALVMSQFLPAEEESAALLQKLTSFGWMQSDPHFQKMLEASTARDQILARYTPKKTMLIKGIPLSVNNNIVAMSLRQVGFTVIPFKPDETPDQMVNIVYYGRDMHIDEVKLATLTLLRAGVDIKAIKPFPKATKGNLRAIKIEFNKYYRNRKSMSPEDIQKAKAFS